MNELEPKSSTPPVAPPAAEHTHQPAVEMTTLSNELDELLIAANGQAMTLGQILDHLKDRGHAMFIIVIIGPFLFLPTTFGLSAPIGFAIAIIGLCITIGIKPWLPGFILRKIFPYEGLEKMIGRTSRMAAKVQKVSRPRLGIMLWPGFINLSGAELVVWAMLMALPGPNFLFAFMITLLAFGFLMRDGVLLLIAHILTLSSPILAYIYREEIWSIIQATISKLASLWEKVQGLVAIAS